MLALFPAVALLGGPIGLPAVAAAPVQVLAERPAAAEPCEAPVSTVEPPTRAPAWVAPRMHPSAAVLAVASSLAPAAEDSLRTVRPVPTDSTESAPRSPRAPPAG
jgi:hypothetical protein